MALRSILVKDDNLAGGPMPKVTDEYRASRRDEIAHAAMRAFHRGGFHATSMADIIAESGLSAGAIYGHFASKGEIIVAVAEKAIDARMDEMEEILARSPMPPPSHLLRVLLTGMIHDLGGRLPMIVQVWGEAMTDPVLREMASTVMSRLRGVYRTYISLWHQRENGVPAVEADERAGEQVVLFLAAAQGFIIQSALFDTFDDEAALRSFEMYLPR